jgi:CRP-like cAMP-binding protein
MENRLLSSNSRTATLAIRPRGSLLYVPAELRVLRALLSMVTLEDTPSPVRLTQDELASFAATTRPTANHVLRQEEERGTVALSRGQVMVLDRQAERAGVDP